MKGFTWHTALALLVGLSGCGGGDGASPASVSSVVASSAANSSATAQMDDLQARHLHQAHMLTLSAVDPDPLWIATRPDPGLIVASAGEHYAVRLEKVDAEGTAYAAVDPAQLQLEVRVQRDDGDFEYVPGEFQGDYVRWDGSESGVLQLSVPADLVRGRLIVGVRPAFDDPAQQAIAERWSTVITAEVWTLQAGVAALGASDVLFPVGTDLELEPSSAFSLETIAQAVLDAADAETVVFPLVVKGKGLGVGDLVDYSQVLQEPYGGRVYRVIDGADDQQLLLLIPELQNVLALTPAQDGYLVQQGVVPEHMLYRQGTPVDIAELNTTDIDHFGPEANATIRSLARGSSDWFETACNGGGSITMSLAPTFSLHPADVGISTEFAIQGPHDVTCTVTARQGRTFPINGISFVAGGPIMPVLRAMLGTGVDIGPYGELRAGFALPSSIRADLGFAFSWSFRNGANLTGRTPDFSGFTSSGDGLDGYPLDATVQFGGGIGLSAKLKLLNIDDSVLGRIIDRLGIGSSGSDHLTLEFEGKAGVDMQAAYYVANAAMVHRRGTDSNLSLSVAAIGEVKATPSLSNLFKYLGLDGITLFNVRATIAQYVDTIKYTAQKQSDDGEGEATAQIEVQDDLIRTLFAAEPTGLADKVDTSVHNDPHDHLTYELSDCDAAGGTLQFPFVACVHGAFCAATEPIALCGGELSLTPVSASGHVGETVRADGSVALMGVSATVRDVRLGGSPLIPAPASVTVQAGGAAREFVASGRCDTRGVLRGEITATTSEGTVSAQNILTCTCSGSDPDCDRSWASPHMLTADGMAYDFIASGDYVMQRVVDTSGATMAGLEVQARFLPGYEVSWPYAAAVRVGSDIVEVTASRFTPDGDGAVSNSGVAPVNTLRIAVNGIVQGPEHAWHAIREKSRTLTLPGGGLIYVDRFIGRFSGTYWDPEAVTILWPGTGPFAEYGLSLTTHNVDEDGTPTPDPFLEFQFIRPDTYAGRERGLMGNNNGDPHDDFMRRNGEVLGADAALSWTALYGLFGGDWLVHPYECLFADGCTMTPDFPTTPAILTPEQRAFAQAACADLIGYYKEACIHDVGLSGQVELVRDYYANTEDLNYMADRLATPGVDLPVYALSSGAPQIIDPTAPRFTLGLQVSHVAGSGMFALIVRPPRHAQALFADGAVGAGDSSLSASLAAGETLQTLLDVRCDTPDPLWAQYAQGWPLHGAVQLWTIDPLSGFASTLLDELPLQCAGTTEAAAPLYVGSDHTLVRDTQKQLRGWGYNALGQLGDGTVANRIDATVVAFPEATTIRTAAAGGGYTLALDEAGRVWAWGGNLSGQLGDGGTEDRAVPALVDPAQFATRTFVAVAAGLSHALALDDTGVLWAWGRNLEGECGDGSATAFHLTPVTVDLSDLKGASVAAFDAGDYHSLLLDDTGKLWSWGANHVGQLGDGTQEDRRTPVAVDLTALGETAVKSLQAGSDYTLVLDADYHLWGWGDGADGQLGPDADTINALPLPLPLDVNITAVAAGTAHVLAKDEQGRLWSWGDNLFGQLGTGSYRLASSTPEVVPLGVTPAAIGAGVEHSVILDENGGLWAWGGNDLYQLGAGSTENLERTAVLIGYLEGNVSISASTVPATITLEAHATSPLGTVTLTNPLIDARTVQISGAGVDFGGTQQVTAAARTETGVTIYYTCGAAETTAVGYTLQEEGTTIGAGEVAVQCTE